MLDGSEAPAETISRLKNEIGALTEQVVGERNRRIYAEQISRETEKQFEIMFHNTHDAIIYLNRHGYVTNANRTLWEVFGLTPEQLVGRDLGSFEFLGPDYMQAIELYKAASSHIPFPKFEMEAFRRDGTRVHIETNAKLVINEGQVDGIINIVRDITPQKNLEKAKNATILGLAKLAESRDDSTGRHLERVREYVRLIAQTIARLPAYADYITPAYIEDIYLSSILHDIGKVSIPDAILLKPGRLTPAEYEIVKLHTIVGGNALTEVDTQLQERSFLKLGKEIAYYHHESWDGSGYPEGMQGESIPLSARIVALADVYDALTTSRVYKEAYSHHKAIDIILREKGKKFDPDIADAFLSNLAEFDRIRRKINGDNAASSPPRPFDPLNP
jgi:PAS domain S-box-containing protein